MRGIPNISLGLAVTVVTGVAALSVLAVLVLSVFGAPALERVGPAPLVAVGGLAALVLAVLGLARRRAGRCDLDRELRQLLEEEAGKPR